MYCDGYSVYDYVFSLFTLGLCFYLVAKSCSRRFLLLINYMSVASYFTFGSCTFGSVICMILELWILKFYV